MTGKSLGTHIRLEDLQSDFDTVYMAIGSWRATPLGIEGENLDGVWLGINYLTQQTKGDAINLGDTVRRHRRRKHRYRLRARRAPPRSQARQTPLSPHPGRNARRALRGRGSASRGRRNDVPYGPEQHQAQGRQKAARVHQDAARRAGPLRPPPPRSDRGQQHDHRSRHHHRRDRPEHEHPVSCTTTFPSSSTSGGDIEIKGKTLQTSEDSIFAGGDCVTGPATVIQAVAAGRHAAESMDSYLMKGYVPELSVDYSCSRGSMEDLPRWEFEDFPRFDRTTMPSISKEARVGTFTEVETGLSEKAARDEARRCLKCGCKERYNCALRTEATAHNCRVQGSCSRAPVLADRRGSSVYRPRPQQVHFVRSLHRRVRRG